MLLTDLNELKASLSIDPANTAEDKELGFYAEYASSLIETVLGRPNLSKRSRTEYYDGNGRTRMTVKSRPVYPDPVPEVYVDQGGHYGSTSGSFSPGTTQLTYGTDFTFVWDQPDGTSRSAVLIRLGGYWPRPSVRAPGLLSPFLGRDTGSVKVVYTAGYTVDNLPPVFRLAVQTLVARIRYMFPLGMQLTSESYEDRSVSFSEDQKDYLMGLIRPMLVPFYANWSF